MIQWLRLIKFISQNGYQCLTAKCWVRCKSWGQSKQLVSQDILSLCALFLLLVGLPERRCTDFEEPRRPKWAPVVLWDQKHWHMLKCSRHIGLIENQWQRPKPWMSALHLLFLLLCLHSSLWALSAALLSSTCISTNMNTAFDLGISRGNICCTSEAKGELKSVPSVSSLYFFVLVQPPHCLLLGIFARTGGGSSPSRGNAKPRNGLKQNRWGMDEWHDKGTQDTIDERFTSV